MREYDPSIPNPETSPRLVNTAEVGGVAVASMAELPAELQETPEVDVEYLESERKKNTTENLRALQKRFGERFVKGHLMEGGGYTGGAARELLAGFMDKPGFAGELKRLIPGKHGALALLKDNHAYIQATLEQLYKDGDPTHETGPAKNPYELARSVGYELSGPFESTSEFVPLDKKDFRPRERLCTFNEPERRLRNYHMLWLRHTEVDSTLPADELSADTLSDTWKTYLRTIGRYDEASDSYDLNNLRPARDDPYGTSSMSVQISRKGTQVSIKNRYNHTVGNPDNTLDSDLDHVTYGLKRAVYHRVGREDLMSKTRVALAEGYIADNDGGIHSYKYEEDNVYYGDYEYIENGVVTTVDRGAYYMISPQLYVPKSGKGDELCFGQRRSGVTGLEVTSDVKFLYESTKAQGGEEDPHMSELRQVYAERDFTVLKERAVEHLHEHFEHAYTGYSQVTHILGAETRSRGELDQLFEQKMTEWQQDGIVDYVVERLITHGELHTPVITPEGLFGPSQIMALAKNFGESQPMETYLYQDLYNLYSASELCGDGELHFSLIPNKYDRELGSADVEGKIAILTRRQSEKPELNYKVPSVLAAVMHWYALRAGGDTLSDQGAFDKTVITHFDMKSKELEGWSRVSYSCVYYDGEPHLRYSNVVRHDSTRLSVG